MVFQVRIAVNWRSTGSLVTEEEKWVGKKWCAHFLQLPGLFKFQSFKFMHTIWDTQDSELNGDNNFLNLLSSIIIIFYFLLLSPKYFFIRKLLCLICKYFLQHLLFPNTAAPNTTKIPTNFKIRKLTLWVHVLNHDSSITYLEGHGIMIEHWLLGFETKWQQPHCIHHHYSTSVHIWICRKTNRELKQCGKDGSDGRSSNEMKREFKKIH